jgi:hypothetical protein
VRIAAVVIGLALSGTIAGWTAALTVGAPTESVLTPATRAAAPVQGTVQLVDVAGTAGLAFEHRHGGTGERYMAETMGSGLALLDIDADGRTDAYLIQQGATPESGPGLVVGNQLFRNVGDGTLADVTARSGTGDTGYGMGVAAADYDNDGFVDIFVANFGRNLLLRNHGDGTFGPVPIGAPDDELWSVSAAWSDFDADGDVDLYVANYVDFTWTNHKFCGDAGRQISAYCHPDVYNAQPDQLYENQGDGTFIEIGARAGIDDTLDGKGLGIVWGDYDNDGDADAYVANDGTRNFLYVNQGDGTFIDESFLAGVGYSEDGRTESGMGTDFGDFNGDGLLDVIVTNLTLETNTLYRNLGDSLFADESFVSGIGEPSLLSVGFGANWMDVDNDGDLDLFVANGHIIDNIALFREGVAGSALAERRYPQPNHLYINDGTGRFEETHQEAGSGMALVKVSRGSAVGDLDNDGDLDVLIVNSNETADYLRNDSAPAGWIELKLVGRSSNRSAVGARVEINTPTGTGTRTIIREVTAGASYASTNDIRIHAGLGAAATASIAIRWPDGSRDALPDLRVNRLYVIHQGYGAVGSRAGTPR